MTPIATCNSATPFSRALRRVLAVLCAIAFLAVGFAHSLQHVDESASTVSTIVVVSAVDDASSVPSKHAPVLGDHCHVCTMTAMPAADSAPLPPELALMPALAGADVFKSYLLPAETPPPIA